MQTIARLSQWKAYTYVAGNIAFCAIVYAMVLANPLETLHGDFQTTKRATDVLFALLTGMAIIFVVLLQLTILRQLVWKQSLAVWIEGGQLYFLDTFGHIAFSKVPTADIQAIIQGSLGSLRRKGLILIMEDGRQEVLPTWLLHEPLEVVEGRLKKMILRDG